MKSFRIFHLAVTAIIIVGGVATVATACDEYRECLEWDSGYRWKPVLDIETGEYELDYVYESHCVRWAPPPGTR